MDSGSRSQCSLGRNDGQRFSPVRLGACAALLALVTAASPAPAEEQVRIGLGFGLAFLPVYICEDLKLVEKYGKAEHLELKPSYQRFVGAGPLQEALGAGALDMAPFGVAPLLAAWEKAKDTPRQIFAASGLTTLPPVLLTNRPDVRTLADFSAADRIVIPSASAPQLYLLQMQSEKVFGQYDKLRGQIVVHSHPDAVADLLAAKDSVTGYFSSAPFTEIALADGRIHKVLSAGDVIDGKASFLVLGATKSYIIAHPKVPEAVARAIDEAARIIRDDPHRAAEIYLAHEPSKTFDAGAIAAVLADLKDEFGSAVHGMAAFADFMGRHGELKSPPQSWKEIVAPALLNSPNT
jgi:ABC-type nitrate/sulfonate/bicarbonate transport system substrate-binding protein